MRVLSLFDGISGAAQALKELDIDCEYYASEIDKYSIQIAKSNHLDIKHIGDIKHISYDARLKNHKWLNYGTTYECKGGSINLSSVDLLIGGSPCQDLSIAKKDRQGLQGERSGLFYEYVRILNEAKPKYFILENVASMSQASRDLISEELGVQPVLINSALLTAQNRKRYYWVGRLVDGKYQQVKVEQPEDQAIYLKDIVESGVVDRDKSYCIDANYFKGGNLKSYFEKGRRQLVFDKSVRVAHLNKGGQGDRIYATNAKSVTLSALGGGRGAKTGLYAIAQRGRNIVNGKRKDIKGSKTEQRFETSYSKKANTLTTAHKDSMLLDIKAYSLYNDNFQSRGKSYSLGTNPHCITAIAGQVLIKDLENYYIIRKLTVKECCRLQGFPDDYVSMVSKTQGYKALGNSFSVPVIKHILKTIYEL